MWNGHRAAAPPPPFPAPPAARLQTRARGTRRPGRPPQDSSAACMRGAPVGWCYQTLGDTSNTGHEGFKGYDACKRLRVCSTTHDLNPVLFLFLLSCPPRGSSASCMRGALDPGFGIRGGLVSKAHSLLYHFTLGSRAMQKKKKVRDLAFARMRGATVGWC